MSRCMLLTRTLSPLATLDRPIRIAYELKHNDLSTAEILLATADPVAALCTAFSAVHLWDGERDLGLYRVSASPASDVWSGGTVTYTLEHMLSTLLDDVIFDAIDMADVPFGDAIRQLLSLQSDARWVLGDCDFDVPISEAFGHETLLAAIKKACGHLQEEYTWHYDTASQPHVLHIRRADADAGCGIHYGRSMVGITREMDASGVVTRLYLLGGADAEGKQVDVTGLTEGGVPYIDADTIGEYGIRAAIYQSGDITDPAALLAKGQAILDEKKDPVYTYQATALDLHRLTGYAWDLYEPGKLVMVTDDDRGIRFSARIVSVAKRDVTGDPGSITVTIASRQPDELGTLTAVTQMVQSAQSSGIQNAANIALNAINIDINAKNIRANADTIDLNARNVHLILSGLTDTLTAQAETINLIAKDLNIAAENIDINAKAIKANADLIQLNAGKVKLELDKINDTLTAQAGTINLIANDLNVAAENINVNANNIDINAKNIKANADLIQLNAGKVKLELDKINDTLTAQAGTINLIANDLNVAAENIAVNANNISAQAKTIEAKADTVRVEAIETEITGLLKVENLQAAIANLSVLSNGSIQSDYVDTTDLVAQHASVSGSFSAGTAKIGGSSCGLATLTIGDKSCTFFAPADATFELSDMPGYDDALAAARTEGASSVTVSDIDLYDEQYGKTTKTISASLDVILSTNATSQHSISVDASKAYNAGHSDGYDAGESAGYTAGQKAGAQTLSISPSTSTTLDYGASQTVTATTSYGSATVTKTVTLTAPADRYYDGVVTGIKAARPTSASVSGTLSGDYTYDMSITCTNGTNSYNFTDTFSAKAAYDKGFQAGKAAMGLVRDGNTVSVGESETKSMIYTLHDTHRLSHGGTVNLVPGDRYTGSNAGTFYFNAQVIGTSYVSWD